MSDTLDLDDVREAIANGDAEPLSYVVELGTRPGTGPAVYAVDGPGVDDAPGPRIRKNGRRAVELASILADGIPAGLPDGTRGVYVIIPAAQPAAWDLAERCRAAAAAAVLRVLAER